MKRASCAISEAAPLQHWLLTVTIAPNANLHCYLMSRDKRDALDAGARLVAEAEKISNYPLINMILMTTLSSDVETVRAILAKRGDEVKRMLQEATNFHFSIWATHSDDPDDAALMRLH